MKLAALMPEVLALLFLATLATASIESSFDCNTANGDSAWCSRMQLMGCNYDGGTQTCNHYASCSAATSGDCPYIRGCRYYGSACHDAISLPVAIFTECNSFNVLGTAWWSREQGCRSKGDDCEWNAVSRTCIVDRDALATLSGVTQTLCEQDGVAVWMSGRPVGQKCTPLGRIDSTIQCGLRTTSTDCNNAKDNCIWRSALSRCLATDSTNSVSTVETSFDYCNECSRFSALRDQGLYSSASIGPSDCSISNIGSVDYTSSCVAKSAFCEDSGTVPSGCSPIQTPSDCLYTGNGCIPNLDLLCSQYRNESQCHNAGVANYGYAVDDLCYWCPDTVPGSCLRRSTFWNTCGADAPESSTGMASGDHTDNIVDNLGVEFAAWYIDPQTLDVTVDVSVPVTWRAGDPRTASFYLGTAASVWTLYGWCSTESATPPVPTTLPVTQGFQDFLTQRTAVYRDFNLTSNDPALQQDTFRPLRADGIGQTVFYDGDTDPANPFLLFNLGFNLVNATSDYTTPGGCAISGNVVARDTSTLAPDDGGYITYTVPVTYSTTEKFGYVTTITATLSVQQTSSGQLTLAASESSNYAFEAFLARVLLLTSGCSGSQRRLQIKYLIEYTATNDAFLWALTDAVFNVTHPLVTFDHNCLGLEVVSVGSPSCVGRTCETELDIQTECRDPTSDGHEFNRCPSDPAFARRYPMKIRPGRCPGTPGFTSDQCTQLLFTDQLNSVLSFTADPASVSQEVLYDVVSGVLQADTDPLSSLQLQGETRTDTVLVNPDPIVIGGPDLNIVARMTTPILLATYDLTIDPYRFNVTLLQGATELATYAWSDFSAGVVHKPKPLALGGGETRLSACIGISGCDGISIDIDTLHTLQATADTFVVRMVVLFAPVGTNALPHSRRLLSTTGTNVQVEQVTQVVSVVLDSTAFNNHWRLRHGTDAATGGWIVLGLFLFFSLIACIFFVAYASEAPVIHKEIVYVATPVSKAGSAQRRSGGGGSARGNDNEETVKLIPSR